MITKVFFWSFKLIVQPFQCLRKRFTFFVNLCKIFFTGFKECLFCFFLGFFMFSYCRRIATSWTKNRTNKTTFFCCVFLCIFIVPSLTKWINLFVGIFNLPLQVVNGSLRINFCTAWVFGVAFFDLNTIFKFTAVRIAFKNIVLGFILCGKNDVLLLGFKRIYFVLLGLNIFILRTNGGRFVWNLLIKGVYFLINRLQFNRNGFKILVFRHKTTGLINLCRNHFKVFIKLLFPAWNFLLVIGHWLACYKIKKNPKIRVWSGYLFIAYSSGDLKQMCSLILPFQRKEKRRVGYHFENSFINDCINTWFIFTRLQWHVVNVIKSITTVKDFFTCSTTTNPFLV